MARRRQAVTIKHVAADAQVSLQTVSRVINNEPNVRAEMKQRVQAADLPGGAVQQQLGRVKVAHTAQHHALSVF